MIGAGLIAVALMQAPLPPSRPAGLVPDQPRAHGHIAVDPRPRPTPWPSPLPDPPPGPQAAQPAPGAAAQPAPGAEAQSAPGAAAPQILPAAAAPPAVPVAEPHETAPGPEAPQTAPLAAARLTRTDTEAHPVDPVAEAPPTAPDTAARPAAPDAEVPPHAAFSAPPTLMTETPGQDRDALGLAEASVRAPDAAPIPLTRAAQTLALAVDAGQGLAKPGAMTGGGAPVASAPGSAPDRAPKPQGRPRAPRPDPTLAALTPPPAPPDRPQPASAPLDRSQPTAPAPRQVEVEVEDGTQLALNAAPSDRFPCRDPRLVGSAIPDIGAPGTGCGVVNPVRITAIGTIRLSTPEVLSCPTARAVANWVTGVANPEARENLGAPIAKIWVMGSYACRNRNGLPGGRLSEHAHGMALDIGGVTLTNGRSTTVLEGWGKGSEGAFWRDVRRAACGGFQTVLGPGSDRYHANHLHLDTSLRGGAPYCR